MTARTRMSTGALVAVAVGVGIVWWVANQPDPGSVDKLREAPEALGAGPIEAVTGPVVTLTSSPGDPTGNPSGTVTTGSMVVDVDDDTLTATSLVDGEPVWTYGRDERSIDDWTVSGDAVWVLFDDQLLVRVDVEAGRVTDSTVFDELADEDATPALTGDGLGGLVLQGLLTAPDPVWWVGRDLDPVALELPSGCDAQGDVTSDGERIYLLALCSEDKQRVVAFATDGSVVWADEPITARSIETDRAHVVVHGYDGSQLLDPASGEVAARVPVPSRWAPYVSVSDGLFVAWESDAPSSRSSLAVWSTDQRRVVWRLPGGDRSEVSAPLVSDGHLYYTRTTQGEGSTFALVVVDVASGGATSTELSSPGSESCDGAATEFRPDIEAGIPGAIVIGWQDDSFCAEPILEVYANAA